MLFTKLRPIIFKKVVETVEIHQSRARKQFASILKKPKLYHFKSIIENSYSI